MIVTKSEPYAERWSKLTARLSWLPPHSYPTGNDLPVHAQSAHGRATK